MALRVKMTAMTLELVLVSTLTQLKRSGRQITECSHMSQRRCVKYLQAQVIIQGWKLKFRSARHLGE